MGCRAKKRRWNGTYPAEIDIPRCAYRCLDGALRALGTEGITFIRLKFFRVPGIVVGIPC